MSNVEVVVTGTIAPTPSPLTINPTADTLNGQVGTIMPSTPVASVTGGVPPYTYALDPALGTVPDGLALSEDGNGNISIAGTPTTAGQVNFGVIATDSAGEQVGVQVKNGAVVAKKIG